MTDTFENERCILGCLIQYPNLYACKIPMLSAEFFSDSLHRSIYETVYSAYKKHGHSYDSAIVISILGEENNKSVSVKEELVACCESVFASTPFDEHLKILYDNAKTRFIRSSLERMQLEGDYSVTSLNELIDVCERAYNLDIDENYKDNYKSYLEGLAKVPKTVKTGFSKIDMVTGGLQQGTLCIVGARPSVGKTTFSLNIAANVCKKGMKVVFFSLEMTTKMVLDRLCSRLCEIDYDKFKRVLSQSEIAKINTYLSSGNFKENLTVIDDVNTVENICSYIVKYKPDVCIVDYAQIVRTVKKYDSIRVQIDYISSQLKQIAKRTKCCIVLLSQLSRKAVGSDKPPCMADLKESSSLEQDGDYIFLLHRPYTENKQDYVATDTKLIVEKNKFGSTGIIRLHFDGSHQAFLEISTRQA